MDRKTDMKTVLLILIAIWSVGCVHNTLAGEDGALPGPAEPDTVHTNLWLTRALMGEIVTSVSLFLPPAPASILLDDRGGTEQDQLFGSVAAGILADRGYELHVADADSMAPPPVDLVFAFNVVGVDLAYPEVGRTLGIWQRWIARDVGVTAAVEVSADPGGKLLFKDVVERRFTDRVDNDDFSAVESDLYEFTTAEVQGSGWQNRMEEIVVLGTLVGLIAIYFANTGN